MAKPGVIITTADAPPTRGFPTNTGVWFASGVTERGPVDSAEKVSSIADFERIYGDRTSASSTLYDAIDTAFREGLTEAYIGRVTGDTPVEATHTFNDDAGSPLASVRVDAKNPGDWGNSLKVQVVEGAGGDAGKFKLVVSLAGSPDVELEDSGYLDDPEAAEAWSAASTWIDVTALGVANPNGVVATALTGGDDDLPAIAANVVTSLDLFPVGLGPGQVSAPGNTDDAVWEALSAHAEATNRVALLDMEDTGVVATLTGAVAGLSASTEYVMFLAGRAIVPGAIPGITRTVPLSAVQAGLESRRDQTDSPNIQAAGEDYGYRYVTDLTQTFSDADRETLLLAGINTAKNSYGTLCTFGYVTAADRDTVPVYWQFNHSRLRMAIKAKAERIGAAYLFKQIDGQGHLLAKFDSSLKGMLSEFYELGSLYGNTPGEAYRVNVGTAINTPTTIANGELRASIAVKMSYGVELVRIDIVTVQLSQAL